MSHPGREIHQQMGGLLKAEQKPLVGPHLVSFLGIENITMAAELKMIDTICYKRNGCCRCFISAVSN